HVMEHTRPRSGLESLKRSMTWCLHMKMARQVTAHEPILGNLISRRALPLRAYVESFSPTPGRYRMSRKQGWGRSYLSPSTRLSRIGISNLSSFIEERGWNWRITDNRVQK